jgi:hypothetical protein
MKASLFFNAFTHNASLMLSICIHTVAGKQIVSIKAVHAVSNAVIFCDAELEDSRSTSHDDTLKIASLSHFY